jgi:hypothetical protein
MIQPIIEIKNLKELDLRSEIFINYFSFSNLITVNNFSIKSSHIIINASSQSNLEKLYISPIPEEYGTNIPLDMNKVRQYLVQKPDFFVACKEGNLEQVKYWIDQKIDINKSNNDGNTPLYISSQKGHIEIVKELLANNVKRNNITSKGFNEVDYSILFGHSNIWILLIGYNEYNNYKLIFEKIEKKDINIGYTNEESNNKIQKIEQKITSLNKENEFPELMKLGVILNTKIGSGQFGDVWKATMKDEYVAVKFLQNASSESLKELFEEVTLLG